MNTYDVVIRGVIARVVEVEEPVIGHWVAGISTDVNGKSVRISGKVEQVL